MVRIAACMQRKIPWALTRKIRSKSARLVVSIVPMCEIPAQLTRMSMDPAEAMVVNTWVTLSGSATSQGRAQACRLACLISSAVALAASALISSTHTCAPFAANRVDMAFPIPLAPPVTTATLPLKSNPSKADPRCAQPFYKLSSVMSSTAVVTDFRGLAKCLVVEPTEIDVVHHPNGDHGEGKDFGAGFEMAGDHFVRGGQGHVGMKLALDDVPIHAHQVSRFGGILHVGIARGHRPVTDLMNLIAAHGSKGGENNSVTNVFLLHHFLHAGKQVRLVLESENDYAIEVTSDGVDVGHRGTVGLGIVSRIGRWIGPRLPGFLSQGHARCEHTQNEQSHSVLHSRLRILT